VQGTVTAVLPLTCHHYKSSRLAHGASKQR